MQNLINTPNSLYFKDVYDDIINTTDYSSSMEIIGGNSIDLVFTLQDLIDAQSDFTNNICLVNRFIPEQNETTYNNYYKFYNKESNVLKSEPFLKNNYPSVDWWPRTHLDDEIGPDGTISFNRNYEVMPLSDLYLKKVAIANYSTIYPYYNYQDYLRTYNFQTVTTNVDQL